MSLKHHILVNVFTAILSFGLGAIFADYWLGPLCLASGFLCSYYMMFGKWQNYIYGMIYTVVGSIACFFNGLYGVVIFTALLYFPLQAYGIANWKKNETETQVEMKSLKFKKSFLLCFAIIAGSFVLGLLLSLIPTQNLAFLDSSSQMLNIGAVVLMMLRYREAWYVWIINNLIDLTIWIINTILNTAYSQMLLLTSIAYLVTNIIGIVLWIRIENKQKQKVKQNIT